ncbi:MAG TPA: hypothetical protein VE621_21475 [Bryobacteraceae bacterium]|nr:hypothetical protein [Bryobacteraceae bacterium]
MNALSICLICCAVTGLVFWFLLRALRSPSPVVELDPEWLAEFSVARYRPMLRLLSSEDFEFLKTQEGYDDSIGRRLRVERQRIFRGYLRNLIRDYHRLHLAARVAILFGEQEHSDLAARLLWHKIEFAFNLMRVEFRLALYAVGIGTVDVRGLLGSVEAFKDQVLATSRV